MCFGHLPPCSPTTAGLYALAAVLLHMYRVAECQNKDWAIFTRESAIVYRYCMKRQLWEATSMLSQK